MPREYEHIKASELRSGKSLKEAKRIAAATYNKRHPGHSLAKWMKRHGETHKLLWSGKAAQ